MPLLVKDVLKYEPTEVKFILPDNQAKDHIDKKRYSGFQCESRGIREWTHFPESDPIFKKYMDKIVSTRYHSWEPLDLPYTQYAWVEDNVKSHLTTTILHRVRAALKASHPGLGIHGEVKRWPRTVAGTTIPDLQVYRQPPLVANDGDDEDDFLRHIVAFGDIKLKRKANLPNEPILPTTKCYKAWLAQPVQTCIDYAVSYAFIITNVELVIAHIVRKDGAPLTRRVTRSDQTQEHASLPENHKEALFSSPDARGRRRYEPQSSPLLGIGNDYEEPLPPPLPPTSNTMPSPSTPRRKRPVYSMNVSPSMSSSPPPIGGQLSSSPLFSSS